MTAPAANTDIANLAFDLLAHEKQLTSMTDGSAEAKLASRWYDATRRRVLRMYPWNFAKKQDTLYVDASETPSHTYAHAYELPSDYVRLMFLVGGDEGIVLGRQFYDVVGTHIYLRLGAPLSSSGSSDNPAATLTPEATTGTGKTFTLSVGLFEASDKGAEIVNDAGTGKARITSITSATVAVATITEDFPDTSAIASGSWTLTAYGKLNITYVYDVETVADFDAMFVDLFATELAVKMSYKMTQKVSIRKSLEELRRELRTDAASISGQEAPPIRVESNPLTRNRRNLRSGCSRGGIYHNI